MGRPSARDPEGDENMADEFTAETLGETLTLWRHRAGLTRDEVAARAEVATGTLSRYELDQTTRPDVVTVRRLLDTYADELGYDSQDLWGAFQTWLLAREEITANVHLAAQVRAITGQRRRSKRPRRR